MKKSEIKKLIDLGFLESDNQCSIYGQEIVDRFLKLLINKFEMLGYKHYNRDFIKDTISGKYYRIVNNTLEVMVSDSNIKNEALDLQYLFSKFLKDNLGIAMIEGSKYVKGNEYYYGYLLSCNLKNVYTIKQNKYKSYLKFNLFNIFYSIINEDSYLSYKILPYLAIIPLHQNKSGVLSYANKVKENLEFSSYLDDRNISPLEKKKAVINKRIPLIIYVGPKEYKSQKVTIEVNGMKEEIEFKDLKFIQKYLEYSLQKKYNNELKNVFYYEKEITQLNELNKIIKINICPNCHVERYKYFLTPFNRVNKSKLCLVCNQNVNNLIFLKKWFKLNFKSFFLSFFKLSVYVNIEGDI